MTSPRPITVGLHPSVLPWGPEIKYTIRTILRTAGYPYVFVVDDGTAAVDVAYLPDDVESDATVRIVANGRSYGPELADREPAELRAVHGVPLLDFDGDRRGFERRGDRLRFDTDIVYGAYWMLSGAREPHYPRDRRDNHDLTRAALTTAGVLDIPVVSRYAALFREGLTPLAGPPLPAPWLAGGQAAILLTHDVDYPEIIRWIEALRAIKDRRGATGVGSILTGRSHFWKFGEWIDLARNYGAAPAFYFMARRGSLWQYATGTPDAFYDIRGSRFVELFRTLVEAECEIGLHASYHAYAREGQIGSEKELLESVARTRVSGGRHHYWHLDPRAPHQTLRKHERFGLRYDSSLGYETHPGFRRGICHPYHVYDPELRRELALVQLPPTWMDDHFHRRVVYNGIRDPDAHAARLLRTVRETGGTAILDYHVRGMNAECFPQYGPWLNRFLAEHVESSDRFLTPVRVADEYIGHARRLDDQSRDDTETGGISGRGVAVEVGPMRPEETDAVARLHHEFFGIGAVHGYSLAMLGSKALADIFYRPNLDNPYLFFDVARYEGEVVAFSVYATNRAEVFRHTLRRRLIPAGWAAAKALAGRPTMIMSVLSNLRYVGGEPAPIPDEIDGWFFLLGVVAPCRSKDFETRVGTNIAFELRRFMETVMVDNGCRGWYGAVRHDNAAMNRFMQRSGGSVVGTAHAQGQQLNYYVKNFRDAEDVALPERPAAARADVTG